LIEHGQTGWLFDLEKPEGFHAAVDAVLSNHEAVTAVVNAARTRVIADYDTRVLASRLKELYQRLGEEKHALCHSA
jgi:glycosyltransferase involved in cell wall biosynthesis